jgi:hypothetical protein
MPSVDTIFFLSFEWQSVSASSTGNNLRKAWSRPLFMCTNCPGFSVNTLGRYLWSRF